MTKTSVTLELKTREAHHLFKRTISGNRLFIDAILHKLNKIVALSKKDGAKTEACYQITKQRLRNLTNYFSNENLQLLEVIQREPALKGKTITFKAQFYPKISLENSLTYELIKLIERYDALISTAKLLYLTGCFESESAYYTNIKRFQVMINQALGQIVITCR